MRSFATKSIRFQVKTIHSEGETVYHVVDSEAPEGEQPAIVASYSTRTLASRAGSIAQFAADTRNEKIDRENRKNPK